MNLINICNSKKKYTQLLIFFSIYFLIYFLLPKITYADSWSCGGSGTSCDTNGLNASNACGIGAGFNSPNGSCSYACSNCSGPSNLTSGLPPCSHGCSYYEFTCTANCPSGYHSTDMSHATTVINCTYCNNNVWCAPDSVSTPTPIPTPFCVPGSLSTTCTTGPNADGGCSSLSGNCAASVTQCNSLGTAYGDPVNVCSDSCKSCLSSTPIPTTAGPTPTPASAVCGGWCTSTSSCCNGSGCACDGTTNTCSIGSGPNDGYCANSSDVQCCVTRNSNTSISQCYNTSLQNPYSVGTCNLTITHMAYNPGPIPITGNNYRDYYYLGSSSVSRDVQVNAGQDCTCLNTNDASCSGTGQTANKMCYTCSDNTGGNSQACSDANSNQSAAPAIDFNNNWGASTRSQFINTTSLYIDANGQTGLGTVSPGYQLKVNGGSCSLNTCGNTSVDVVASPLSTQTYKNQQFECGYTQQNPVTTTVNLLYCGNGICDCGETNTTCPADCGSNVTLIPTPTPIPTYSVSGDVFADANSNGQFDPGEGYAGAMVYINNGFATFTPITTSSNGDYSFTSLPAGSYNVSLNPIPTGYTAITPTTYAVTVGPNVSGLNFGISNHTPWIQGTGGDIRMGGDFSDPIPSPVPPNYVSLPGSGGTPGTVFAYTSDFCSGAGGDGRCSSSASSKDWLVTGQFFKAANKIPTYESVTSQNIQPPKSLPSDCGTGCSITSLTHGYYLDTNSTGVTLDGLTLSSGTAVIAIKGDLYINGNISANGGTLIFLVGGKIYVGSNVGTTNNSDNTCSVGNTANCQIQGFYVADSSFQINSASGSSGKCNSDGSPIDKRLNILGGVVANASLDTGFFAQYRDLCNQDPNYPTVSIFEDPDMMLNIPPFVSQSNNIWQEVAP